MKMAVIEKSPQPVSMDISLPMKNPYTKELSSLAGFAIIFLKLN